MSKLYVDLQDIYFNLFKYLSTQNNNYGLEESEIKGIFDEFLKFVENEVLPCREKLDHDGVKHINGKVVTPDYLKPLTRSFYENGWFAIGLPEAIEGVPAPHTLFTVLEEVMMAANASYTLYPSLSKSAMNLILAKGNEAQKTFFVPKMMAGEWGGTMCLTEPGAGSDVGNLRSTAQPLENGKFKIKGEKIFISSGESDLYKNNIHLVLARTPDAPAGSKGISLFVVPRFKVDDSGNITGGNDVTCSKIEEKMGIHGSATCALSFGLNGDCEGELLGDEFAGMANMFHMMNEARLLCGNQGSGQSNFAYEITKRYAMERSQFGKDIASLPDVKRMLLKMRSMNRALRGMSLYISDLLEKEKNGDESVSAEVAFLTPVFKVMGTERAYEIATDAIQVHGGYGYCQEYGVEQFARDIKITTIYEGTTGIQCMDFVNRKILGDGGKVLAAKLTSFNKKVEGLTGESWQSSKEIMQEAAQAAADSAALLQKWAGEKKIAQILEHSNALLEIFGRIFLAEIILDHGLLAEKELESANSEEKTYFSSKIEDVSCFSSMHLNQVFAYHKQIAFNGSIENLAIS